MGRAVYRFVVALVALLVATAVSAQNDAPLVAATNDGTAINITIPIFDPGIPEDPAAYRDMQVFPRIREIEAKLMPFLLREQLVGSEQWGAVRVESDPDYAAELQILGTIVRSDGDWLEVRIQAIDATGRSWLDKNFSGQASDEPVEDETEKGTPEFLAIYTDIAKELAAVRDEFGDNVIANIKGTSLMLYASALSPTAFGDYIERHDDGTVQLLRLPSRDDPMLRRIETIRSTEFVITDTVDTKFREFNADLSRTYRIWREYRRKFVEYKEWNVEFAESKQGEFPRGTWESIQHQYDAYKYDRVTVQEQDRLAVAFNNEVTSTVEAMEERVAELEGWVNEGYLEWRGLLEQLHEIEANMETEASQF